MLSVDMIIQEEQMTIHHGRPGLTAKRKRALVKELSQPMTEDAWRELVLSLVTADSISARQIGAVLLGETQSEWMLFSHFCFILANDEDWEVREWVVHPLIVWWKRDAERTDPLFEHWLALGGRPRRAIIMAVLSLLRKGLWPCEKVLAVAEQVIDDPDMYIIANVGSFLVGDGLLPLCPVKTMEFVQWQLERNIVPPAVLKNMLGLLSSKAALQEHVRLAPIIAANIEKFDVRQQRIVRRWLGI